MRRLVRGGGREWVRGRGGVWVLGQSVLMTGVVLSGVIGAGAWHVPFLYVVGWVLFGLGGVVGVVGVVHLGRARTAFPRPLADRELVTGGVYGWVRHPLYLSVMLASWGWALIWASYWTLGLTLVLTVYLDAKARREEHWLREVYSGYAAYAKRVRRLVPWLY